MPLETFMAFYDIEYLIDTTKCLYSTRLFFNDLSGEVDSMCYTRQQAGWKLAGAKFLRIFEA